MTFLQNLSYGRGLAIAKLRLLWYGVIRERAREGVTQHYQCTNGSQWINIKRMWNKALFMQLLPPSSKWPMPASQFYSCSPRLSKEEGSKKDQKPAFMDAYINADEESRVFKSVKKWVHPPDKMQGFVLKAGRMQRSVQSNDIFSRD